VSIPATPQVKSLTLVTLRNELESRYLEQAGSVALARLWDTFLPETRIALEEAEPGGWVDEPVMYDVMTCLLHAGFDGDEELYTQFLRGVATAGISRFMKILLSLSSATFALRRIPAVWSHLRRNAGAVTATRHASGVRLRYEGFPYFDFAAYRLLSVANCQALVEVVTEELPATSIEDWTKDTLQLDFTLKA